MSHAAIHDVRPVPSTTILSGAAGSNAFTRTDRAARLPTSPGHSRSIIWADEHPEYAGNVYTISPEKKYSEYVHSDHVSLLL